MIDVNVSLAGKVALVTGATGLLGERFCSILAKNSASVAVVDLFQDKCDELTEKLSAEYGVKSVGIACDITDTEQVEAMACRAERELGAVTILHNNAASKSDNLDAFFAPFEDYSLDEWRKVMAVNIDGMFLVAQAVGGRMAKAGNGGSIIQTASIYGIMGPDNRIYEGSLYLGKQINTPAVYSASKGAVVALTKYLATYWADKGIRVNTLTPGGVESGQNDEFKKKYANRVPLGRMAQPDEMTGALLFLASDASSYMTGQNVVVDGGLSAW